jgi:hypothetical protein
MILAAEVEAALVEEAMEAEVEVDAGEMRKSSLPRTITFSISGL